MSKKTINSHYVPRLTLRQWSPKLCLFNVKTGEYKEDVKIDKAFCEKEFYSPEVEENLNKKIESQFGDLFNNKILKADSSIELSRDELWIIKKFLFISIVRSYHSEKSRKSSKNLQKHRNNIHKNQSELSRMNILNEIQFIHNLKMDAEEQTNNEARNSILKSIKEHEKNLSLVQSYYDKYAELMEEASQYELPFKETEIEGETPFEHWMRTLNVILDTNGTPEEIYNHPNRTYEAFFWAEIIKGSQIAFWDSEYVHDEFVITDMGMTSENEKGWDQITAMNIRKISFMESVIESAIEKGKTERNGNLFLHIFNAQYWMDHFTENFMMFPISPKRMIVHLNPFFKFRAEYKNIYKRPVPDLDEITEIPNEELFSPNKVKYINQPNSLGQPIFHPDDRYIYDIKKLTSKETIYCNELFLDRIHQWVGFSSLDKALKSIFAYKRRNSLPGYPRVDYKKLYKIINERYSYCHINLNSIATPETDWNDFSIFSE